VRLGRGSSGLLDDVALLEAERWLASPDSVDLGCDVALPALVEASRKARSEEAAQQRQISRFRLDASGAIAVLIIAALSIGLRSNTLCACQSENSCLIMKGHGPSDSPREAEVYIG
jgi:hypothetical protein